MFSAQKVMLQIEALQQCWILNPDLRLTSPLFANSLFLFAIVFAMNSSELIFTLNYG